MPGLITWAGVTRRGRFTNHSHEIHLHVSLFIRCTMRCEIWAQPAVLKHVLMRAASGGTQPTTLHTLESALSLSYYMYMYI